MVVIPGVTGSGNCSEAGKTALLECRRKREALVHWKARPTAAACSEWSMWQLETEVNRSIWFLTPLSTATHRFPFAYQKKDIRVSGRYSSPLLGDQRRRCTSAPTSASPNPETTLFHIPIDRLEDWHKGTEKTALLSLTANAINIEIQTFDDIGHTTWSVAHW